MDPSDSPADDTSVPEGSDVVNAPVSVPAEDSVVDDPAPDSETDPETSEVSVAGSAEEDDPSDPVLLSVSGDEVTSDPAWEVETETTDSSVEDSVDPESPPVSLIVSVDSGADVELGV